MRLFWMGVVFLLILMPISLAELSIEKFIEEDNILVGGSATIIVKITNPHSQDIPFKIVDENIFGNNGIKVDCLEDIAKANAVSQFNYEPIIPYAADNTILPPAKVTYTDLEGNEVTVESNELNVTVIDSGTQTNVQMQGITTIYRCDGKNMQSTSYSQSQQQNQQNPQSSQQKQQSEQMQDIQDQMNGQTEDRLQNQQMAQDTNALKQQMQKQAQEVAEIKQEFAENLQKNEELNKEHQELLEQGYNLTSFNADPENSTSGNFEIQYQNQKGETASLTGSMENNELTDLTKESSVEQKQLFEQLQQDQRFQEMDEKLQQQGFQQEKPEIQKENGVTKLRVPYKQNESTASITATIENGLITDVRLEQDREGLTNILAIAVLLGLAGTTLLAYNRFYKQQTPELVTEKPINFKAKAKSMLKDAKRLFDDNNHKLAYQRASEAVRFYYSHKFGTGTELSQNQAIDQLKDRNLPYAAPQNCLNLCRMVEFAKYTTNREDFSEILANAEKIVK